jgi:predicted nucleic acid-binding protein
LQHGSALINPTSEDYSAAFELSERFADQPISLHDATLAVLSRRLDTVTWTFDHHFDLMGVAVWRA